ncbi:GNAT family N-acetyltransferase [Moraxella marmotae]|uniref:GNAT family N-acetyltransferase n=1 Tax=Moraxella marmotae TaxID=3344520 RepID=UPI0035F45A6D
MITLTPLTATHYDDLSYVLSDEQQQFTVLPSVWFDDDNLHAHKVAILDNGRAVGFFVLDFGQDKYRYTDDAHAVLLRSMSINPAFQGKGYAKNALNLNHLQQFCQTHIPLCHQIVLGVNHANWPAQRIYEKLGFVKQARTVMGQKGEQWVYALNL